MGFHSIWVGFHSIPVGLNSLPVVFNWVFVSGLKRRQRGPTGLLLLQRRRQEGFESFSFIQNFSVLLWNFIVIKYWNPQLFFCSQIQRDSFLFCSELFLPWNIESLNSCSALRFRETFLFCSELFLSWNIEPLNSESQAWTRACTERSCWCRSAQGERGLN